MKKHFFVLIAVFLLFFTRSSFAFDFEVILDESPIEQGKTFAVYVEPGDKLSGVTGTFLGREIPFYQVGDKYRGLFGVPADAPAGITYLSVRAVDKKGAILDEEVAVNVIKGKFRKDVFSVPKAKAKLMAPEIIQDDWQKIAALVVQENEDQYWSGKFQLPASGRISMPFGQHKGVDISAKIGTPVGASNAGRVVLAEKLLSHGNTVVIDHGQGIFSIYLHLDRIQVAVGQQVEKGQLIGTVGNTGISTGPHLHFGLSVHDVRVDPLQWIEGRITND